jgi:hypothetical protein
MFLSITDDSIGTFTTTFFSSSEAVPFLLSLLVCLCLVQLSPPEGLPNDGLLKGARLSWELEKSPFKRKVLSGEFDISGSAVLWIFRLCQELSCLVDRRSILFVAET